MKYFRTKDGIWLFGGTHHKGDVIIGKKQEIDFGYCFDKKDLIKQADTIDELCDRCVVIHKYGEQPKDMSFYEAQYFIDVWTRKVKSNDPIVAIYGAIWTDKGLIYVTKINKKGELELL